MPTARLLFTLLILAVAVERLAELKLSTAHATWSKQQGGREFSPGHYPVMVTIHTGLLVGAVVEVWWAHRAFIPALGWPMLALLLASQGLRWWCIATLGRRWNTRIIVIPARPLVSRGPYRLLAHPNYVAVVVEGIALPLVCSAWITALCFTVANAGVLAVRIRAENRALAAA